MSDWKQRLAICRQNLGSRTGDFWRENRREFEIPHEFPFEPGDSLERLWQDQELLFTRGEVQIAAVVMANSHLFHRAWVGAPALVVHSPDRRFEEDPDELFEIAEALDDLRNGSVPDEPELVELHARLLDEHDRKTWMPVPKEIAGAIPCYLSTCGTRAARRSRASPRVTRSSGWTCTCGSGSSSRSRCAASSMFDAVDEAILVRELSSLQLDGWSTEGDAREHMRKVPNALAAERRRAQDCESDRAAGRRPGARGHDRERHDRAPRAPVITSDLMSSIHPLFLTGFVLFAACAKDAPQQTMSSSNNPPPAQTPAKPAAETPAQPPANAPVKAPAPAPTAAGMDASIQELMAKAERPDERIEVQHILISFDGGRVPGVTRSKDEAKVLAEKVYAEVLAGGEFGALVKQYTNDSAPGIYPMTKAGRAGMVQAFGDVGFRLEVGEIGVAPWNAKASPYGWHIIKRLK